MDDERRRRALRTLVLVGAAELVLAAAAHRFDPLLSRHAWLALVPPVTAQLTRPRGEAGAAPVVAGSVGVALGALVLVLLGDRTWAYAAWLPPACAGAAAVAGLVHRRLHRAVASVRLESAEEPMRDRTVGED